MNYDIVIYGSTPAGIAAAVQAKRMGLHPVVLEPGRRIGGLTSGGLGDTDFGDKRVIGGLSLEFYKRLGLKYGEENAVWMFEPKTALAVFQDWVNEHDIEVVYGQRLDRVDGVTMSDRKIRSVRMESGKSFAGRMFIDASYEGDLMKGAGVSCTTGREDNREYGESYNGIQTAIAVKNQLPPGIDPYRIPGNPASGLLPGVNSDAGGEDSRGDHRIQAYCYRMCLT
ncbi:MAG: FAD-dependent oxidoreductase, partial [Paenibacillus sp.]|nr:FAD-dependent oxidoreductase [Paenibacillus sp.]